MLAGLLMISKGDRIAMNSSVETRYPFLDDDVIAFCCGDRAGVQAARHDREVAAPPGGRHGRCRPQIANRPKTMFRASRSRDIPRTAPPGLGRPAPEPRVARGTG